MPPPSGASAPAPAALSAAALNTRVPSPTGRAAPAPPARALRSTTSRMKV